MGEPTRAGGRTHVSVKSGRRTPFVWMEPEALDALRPVFEGRRLPIARSIYVALCEMVAENGGAFEATRHEVAERAGVTRKALDDYVPDLEAAGVVGVVRRAVGNGNLPNVWTILPFADVVTARVAVMCVYCDERPATTADHVLAQSKGGTARGNLAPACHECNSSKKDHDAREWAESRGFSWEAIEDRLRSRGVKVAPPVPGTADDPVHPSSDSSEVQGEMKKNGGSGGADTADPLADVDAPEEMLIDARELLRRKTRVDGRQVTPEEMGCAVAALAEFNRQAGSQFGVGAHLRAVVMRVRERPSMDAAKHVRLVQSAWRRKWWERNGRGRRATPAVVYGNERVFEAVVQDAVDEAAGRPPEEGEAVRRRFTRED